MSKFRTYNSPLKRLFRLVRIEKFINDTYYKYNKFDDYDESSGVASQDKIAMSPRFFGAFHPWFSMAKDVTDSFKPYKSSFYVWRDLLQPFRGLGNIMKGLVYLPITPLLFISNILQSIYPSIKERNLTLFTSGIKLSFVYLFASLFDGFNNIIRGVSQIVTTPLNWFIRMPLRALITAIHGWPTFEETQRDNANELAELVEQKNKSKEDFIEIDGGFKLQVQQC